MSHRQPRVCFDVDGTLIHQDTNPHTGRVEDTPRYEVIWLFHLLHMMGCDMYIWSGSGQDWAIRWRDKLNLRAEVVEKGSFQPDIAIDDMDVSLGRVNLKVEQLFKAGLFPQSVREPVSQTSDLPDETT